MFSENLKTVRKSKRISQEELAVRLHVVRQTVSKWEKGLSVPDAEMLIKISEIFEIPVSELLGVNLENEVNKNEVAEQLARINEQLAVKNRRTSIALKIVLFIIVAYVLFHILLFIVGLVAFESFKFDKHSNGTTQTEIVVPN